MDLRRGPHGVVRVGHRGAAALAPENSLAAIEAAAAHGVDAVELDVLRVADGSLALAHGPEVAAGSPSLDDGLALAADLGLAVQVDVKDGGLEADIVDALSRHDLLARSFVSSSSLALLAAFAAVEPRLPRSFTYPQDRHGIAGRRLVRPVVRPVLAGLSALLPRRLPAWLRAAGASAATLNWTVVSPATIEACHRAGAAVYVWTVNEAALATTLAESDIDGIITDDPRIFPGGIATS
jgi:glycerophosphoryl diester phosphodiesterase